jgi:hypothetical protein
MWTNNLKKREVERTKKAISILKDVEWAKPLLKRFKDGAKFIDSNKPLIFEVRFAEEIYDRGLEAVIETPGVNNSSIDFKIQYKGNNWLIELVSIQSSDAATEAVTSRDGVYSQLLQSNNFDQRQTPEGEVILVEQKIGEKVYRNNKPHKFPKPKPHVYNIIIVDMRGFFDGRGGDKINYTQIACGAAAIPESLQPLVMLWNGKPIMGLYEKNNPLKSAKYIRQRIHYLGFIAEKKYFKHELKSEIFYIPNLNFFDNLSASKVYNLYPMKSITNAYRYCR